MSLKFQKILKRINNIKKIKKEIIIVNDGSTDDTSKIINKNCKHLYDKYVNYKKNRGKGYACRLGLKKVTGEIIIIQDADLEYDPKDYEKLIKPIIKKKSKIVYGSRVLKGGKRTRPKTIDVLIRLCANYFLTFLSNIFNNHELTDAHTCYKVFTSDLLRKIKLEEVGFKVIGIGGDGSINLSENGKNESFFPFEKYNLKAVYEVLCEKI